MNILKFLFDNLNNIVGFIGVVAVVVVAFILLRSNILNSLTDGYKKMLELRDIEIKELTDQVAHLQAGQDALRQEVREVKEHSARKEEENVFLRNQNVELQRQLADGIKTNKRLEGDLDQSRQENLELHRRFVEITLEKECCQQEAEELKQRLHNLGQETRHGR